MCTQLGKRESRERRIEGWTFSGGLSKGGIANRERTVGVCWVLRVCRNNSKEGGGCERERQRRMWNFVWELFSVFVCLMKEERPPPSGSRRILPSVPTTSNHREDISSRCFQGDGGGEGVRGFSCSRVQETLGSLK